MNKLYVLLIVVALAGCSLAPDYTRPALPTPATYPDDVLHGGFTKDFDSLSEFCNQPHTVQSECMRG